MTTTIAPIATTTAEAFIFVQGVRVSVGFVDVAITLDVVDDQGRLELSAELV